MFPFVSGSEGSKGFPATRYFTPGNQCSPELGSNTLFTLPVANLNDTMVDPRCKVLYMQH
jgi:hypothetical protein